MTILLTGGGTLGPVTPLLAAVYSLKKIRSDLKFVWAGTSDGPERALVSAEGIDFYPVPRAKLTRYPSLSWLTLPRDYWRATRVAKHILTETMPDLVVSVGGYTQVPVMRCAARQGIPCAVHQLDKLPGLSNRLVAPLCRSVTTTFVYKVPPFGRAIQTTHVATPCRLVNLTIPDRAAAADRFLMDPSRPIIFVLGGGTGALKLNEAIATDLDSLLEKTQVIHAMGIGKRVGAQRAVPLPHTPSGYFAREFLDERDLLFAYAAADVVICRAGMGTLSELAALSKVALVVPMPDTHQEANAVALQEAIVSLRQTERLGQELQRIVFSLLDDTESRQRLGAALHRELLTDGGRELAEHWLGLV